MRAAKLTLRRGSVVVIVAIVASVLAAAAATQAGRGLAVGLLAAVAIVLGTTLLAIGATTLDGRATRSASGWAKAPSAEAAGPRAAEAARTGRAATKAARTRRIAAGGATTTRRTAEAARTGCVPATAATRRWAGIAATPCAAWRTIARFVDDQRTTIERRTVQRPHRLLRVVVAAHLDEPEAA